jgi:hypothetical protein
MSYDLQSVKEIEENRYREGRRGNKGGQIRVEKYS